MTSKDREERFAPYNMILTLGRKLTKQTNNMSKCIDLHGSLKTADHCEAIWRAGGKPSTWSSAGTESGQTAKKW